MSDYKPTTAEIKELRAITLAGFQDCQKALTETGGNMNDAVDLIRKRGLSVAAKKAHRDASEGLITVSLSPDQKIGAMIELNCESDFVAKGELFKTLSDSIAAHVRDKVTDGRTEGESLYNDEIEPGITLKTKIDELIGKIGENMGLKRVVRFQTDGTGLVHSYIHPPGKVGVLVEVGFDNDADKSKADELAHDIALQIAFSDPSFISPADIPADTLAHERKLAEEKAREQGKPEHIVPKIAEGMLNKYFQDECLLHQAFAKDPNLTVSDLLQKSGISGLTIKKFSRFALK